MKILMVISRFPPHVGGTEQQAFLLSQELTRRGTQVHILTQRYKKHLKKSEIIDGMVITRLGPGDGFPLSSYLFLVRGFLFIVINRHKFELIHAHMLAVPAIMASLTTTFFKKKSIVKISCSGSYGEIKNSQKNIFNRIKTWFVLKSISSISCISTEIKQELLGNGVAEPRLGYLPNGVDTNLFYPVTDLTIRNEIRSRLGLELSSIVFLYSGRFVKQKRLDIFLEAISKLRNAHLKIEIMMVGGGQEKRNLQKLADDLKLNDSVHFYSAQFPMPNYYIAADYFVLPSEAEGLSNSLLEAMASGLVCIASDIGGNIDVIENGKNGLLFNRGSTQDLMKKIEGILTQPNTINQIRKNARESIINKFGISSIAQQYLNFYQRVLEL